MVSKGNHGWLEAQRVGRKKSDCPRCEIYEGQLQPAIKILPLPPTIRSSKAEDIGSTAAAAAAAAAAKALLGGCCQRMFCY